MRLQTFMAENKDSSAGKEKELLVDDMSSEEETVNPELRTTEEERYSTIPGSVQAMAMALMCSSHAHTNPTVERCPSKDTKRRIKILNPKPHR